MSQALLLALLLSGLAGAASPRDAPAPSSSAERGSVRVLVQVATDTEGNRERAEHAVVWVPGSVAPERRPRKPPRLASRKKRFEPRILAVPVGTTVEFPNFDRIFHNVFSLSATATFDLGLYRNGDYRPYTFRSPGVVKVYCNIHPQMAAYVIVVDGDAVALTGTDGVATLDGLPAGRTAIRVWDERGGEATVTAEVAPGKTTSVDVVLDATRWREAPHQNKYGKDYPPPEEDENRY